MRRRGPKGGTGVQTWTNWTDRRAGLDQSKALTRVSGPIGGTDALMWNNRRPVPFVFECERFSLVRIRRTGFPGARKRTFALAQAARVCSCGLTHRSSFLCIFMPSSGLFALGSGPLGTSGEFSCICICNEEGIRSLRGLFAGVPCLDMLLRLGWTA